jgi:glycosyltransferase involved in cell wall biosynthesis
VARTLPLGRPLRVAYVTGKLGLGGSERQMILLAKHLPRDRFEVEFVLLGPPGELADEARAAGARIEALHGPPRGSASFPVWAYRVLESIWAFVRLARRRHFDVVDAWLFGSYALAAVTRPVTRVPVLVSGRRSLSDYKAGFSFAQRLADRIATRSSDAIVANADAVAEDVRRRERLPAHRIRVIRNAVEIVAPPTAEERRSTRAGWGADESTVVVGCVANYKQRKGLEMLVEAFAAAGGHDRDTRLVLVGEGPLRGELQARIARAGVGDRVVLAGEVLDPRALYYAFDVAVLASESEGLPNVLLEAAAAGRPLIATDAGASRDIVIDGRTGILVPIGDRERMTAAIARLVDDPRLRASYGAAARSRAESEFSVERSVAGFAALYEELAAARADR